MRASIIIIIIIKSKDFLHNRTTPELLQDCSRLFLKVFVP